MMLFDGVLDSQWFLSVVSNVAVFTTICLFLTGFEICWRVWRRGSTDGISSAPFHMGLVSGSLWLQYGLLKGDAAVIRVNFVALFLYVSYVTFYWMKTSYGAKSTQNRIICFEAVFLAFVALYCRHSNAALSDVLNFLGLLCLSFNIATVAAPLAALREVTRTRSTENLPLPLCVANLLVTSEWLLYGVLVDDFFIKFPNAVAVGISIAQVSLFLIYPRRRKVSSVSVE